jgi:hypothetical protein
MGTGRIRLAHDLGHRRGIRTTGHGQDHRADLPFRARQAAAGQDPEDSGDHGDKLTRAGRLDHVVVGAQLEAPLDVVFLGLGGEHDHRHPCGRLVRPPPHQHLEAGYLRHHHIEQHQVGDLLGDLWPVSFRRCRVR